MYGGTAYGSAAYAGSGSVEQAVEVGAAAFLMVVGGGEYVETTSPAVVLPSADVHRYVKVLVYPTPDLVDGRPT